MILIALGANIPSRFGNPAETIRAACRALEEQGAMIVGASSLWLTAPVPVSDQPWYHNAVIVVETALSATALFAVLKDIEAKFGRENAARNAPRILDLDLIAFDQEVISSLELTVPHPRMEDRAFVLYPLQQVAPSWIHPVSIKNIAEMIAALPADQEIQQMEGIAA